MEMLRLAFVEHRTVQLDERSPATLAAEEVSRISRGGRGVGVS